MELLPDGQTISHYSLCHADVEYCCTQCQLRINYVAPQNSFLHVTQTTIYAYTSIFGILKPKTAALCCVATGTQAQLVEVDITVVCVTSYTKMSSNMQRKI